MWRQVLTIYKSFYQRCLLTVFLEAHWTSTVPFEAAHYHTYRVPLKNTSGAPLKLIVTHLYIIACLLHQTSRYVSKTSKVSHNGCTLLAIVD